MERIEDTLERLTLTSPTFAAGSAILGADQDPRGELRLPISRCREKSEMSAHHFAEDHMLALKSYLNDQWVSGDGEGTPLFNPTTNTEIARTSSKGLDLGSAVRFARDVGGPALRSMTFAERGALLKTLSLAIHERREALIEDSIRSGGTTRKGAKFDLDGASATLAHYAELGASLGDKTFLVEGDGEVLARSARFCGYHVRIPRRGVAVHINAFNFPAWGLAEKAACALLAGMPVISKPGTSTATLAFHVMEAFVDSGALPKGALQFLCGSAGDLLDHLGGQDVIAFTGSADTAARLRAHPAVVERSCRINVEADSLNAMILGDDLGASDDTYQTFLRHAVTEMTQKSGQKCTATRRIFVPAARIDDVQADLIERLKEQVVGDPSVDGVDVGPLATKDQVDEAKRGLARLVEAGAKVVFGDIEKIDAKGADSAVGAFVPMMLLRADDPASADAVHAVEVFGPVATLLPYETRAEAVAWTAAGGGTLVTSVYSDDKAAVEDFVLEIAPFTGRVLLVSAKVTDTSIAPGLVLPSCVHGGPGRAGGGEELGGERGMHFYMQRTALQGDRGLFDRALGIR